MAPPSRDSPRIDDEASVRRILAAVDGSPASRRAADLAGSLARKFDAELILISVVEPAPGARSPEGDADLGAAFALLEDVGRDLGIDRIDSVVHRGYASEVICHEALDRKVDIIVLGAEGMDARPRVLLGSVSYRVAHLARCTVTIVR
jgi:nucleotide-binding universal stress UspA family protein